MKRKQMYPSTETVLYMIVQLVCNLCLKQLKDFSGFKKKYTTAYVNDILASLQAAKALPSFSSQQGKQINQRKQVEKQNKSIMRYFQKLLLYIKDSFAEDLLEGLRREAGGDLYLAAGQADWKASTDMQVEMGKFMATYAAELAAGGMPADFATNFGVLTAAFADTLVGFDTSKTSQGQDTANRLDANNSLYKRAMGLMDDGKEIFVEEPDMVNQFSYRWLMKKLGGQGDTGFRFSLKAEGTLLPVTMASVSFLPSGLDFLTEQEEAGVILVYLPELKKDESYQYMLTAPGYEEMVGTLVADTGVMHRVDLIMKKEVMSVEPPSQDEKVS